ncbi:hypothetical protein KIPB_015093, partial [Kipferlia bialata]
RTARSDKPQIKADLAEAQEKLQEMSGAAMQRRRLVSLLQRYTDFPRVAAADLTVSDPLEDHPLARYRPLYLDLPLSQFQ